MDTQNRLEGAAGMLDAAGGQLSTELLGKILAILEEIKAEFLGRKQGREAPGSEESKDSARGELVIEPNGGKEAGGGAWATAAKNGKHKPQRSATTKVPSNPARGKKLRATTGLEPSRLLFFGLLRGVEEEWVTIKTKVLTKLEKYFGIPTPVWAGKAGPHVIAQFRTKKEAAEATARCYAIAIDEARKMDYITCLVCPHVPPEKREKRDKVMKTMLHLLKYHQSLIRGPSMLELWHTTMEVCEEAHEIMLPWLEELEKEDFSPKAISEEVKRKLLALNRHGEAMFDAVQRRGAAAADTTAVVPSSTNGSLLPQSKNTSAGNRSESKGEEEPESAPANKGPPANATTVDLTRDVDDSMESAAPSRTDPMPQASVPAPAAPSNSASGSADTGGGVVPLDGDRPAQTKVALASANLREEMRDADMEGAPEEEKQQAAATATAAAAATGSAAVIGNLKITNGPEWRPRQAGHWQVLSGQEMQTLLEASMGDESLPTGDSSGSGRDKPNESESASPSLPDQRGGSDNGVPPDTTSATGSGNSRSPGSGSHNARITADTGNESDSDSSRSKWLSDDEKEAEKLARELDHAGTVMPNASGQGPRTEGIDDKHVPSEDDSDAQDARPSARRGRRIRPRRRIGPLAPSDILPRELRDTGMDGASEPEQLVENEDHGSTTDKREESEDPATGIQADSTSDSEMKVNPKKKSRQSSPESSSEGKRRSKRLRVKRGVHQTAAADTGSDSKGEDGDGGDSGYEEDDDMDTGNIKSTGQPEADTTV